MFNSNYESQYKITYNPRYETHYQTDEAGLPIVVEFLFNGAPFTWVRARVWNNNLIWIS